MLNGLLGESGLACLKDGFSVRQIEILMQNISIRSKKGSKSHLLEIKYSFITVCEES